MICYQNQQVVSVDKFIVPSLRTTYLLGFFFSFSCLFACAGLFLSSFFFIAAQWNFLFVYLYTIYRLIFTQIDSNRQQKKIINLLDIQITKLCVEVK